MTIFKIYLKKEYGFLFFMLLSLLLAFYKIVLNLNFIPLPLFFFALGLISYRLHPERSLYLFLFLLPLVNALPDFFFNGYPFNYMGIALFYLSGIFIAAQFFKSRSSRAPGIRVNGGPGLEGKTTAPFDYKWAGPYLLFLVILWVSALFVLLRWSNITLPSLAFWRDTPVTPAVELVPFAYIFPVVTLFIPVPHNILVSIPTVQLVSFASIFPVVALFLFSTAPYILVLIKKHRLQEVNVFKALLAGYTISFAVGLYQKFVNPDFLAISWWGEKLNQYNGGFSDFNAFGFFSGVLFLYLVITLVNRFTGQSGVTASRRHQGLNSTESFVNILNPDIILLILGLIITLAGVFLSGCRTAFLFILIAAAFLLFSRKIKLLYKLISILLIVILLIAAGGTLKKRILAMAANVKKVGRSTNIITALDKVTNGRIEMMQRSIPIIKKYPLSGVGSGNFLFFLKYRYLGEKYWEDLPLNQYLLILDETGFIGLLVFACFLTALLKQKRKRIYSLLLFSLLVAIFFNFFFWFPECLLLFWIISSFAEEKITVDAGSGRRKKVLFSAALLLLFVLANIFHFDSLHPKTWAKEKGREYGYGFWYLEKNPADEVYRWTKARAGVYLYLDKNGESKQFKLFCGAPIEKLQDNKQEVEIFWRGKLYTEVIFRDNKEYLFKVKDKPYAQGFLELRVSPTFNLKKMKISPEFRDLGVQFYTLF